MMDSEIELSELIGKAQLSNGNYLSQDWEFDKLSQVNLFIGENNSGKSRALMDFYIVNPKDIKTDYSKSYYDEIHKYLIEYYEDILIKELNYHKINELDYNHFFNFFKEEVNTYSDGKALLDFFEFDQLSGKVSSLSLPGTSSQTLISLTSSVSSSITARLRKNFKLGHDHSCKR